jgi:hypothetical protein
MSAGSTPQEPTLPSSVDSSEKANPAWGLPPKRLGRDSAARAQIQGAGRRIDGKSLWNCPRFEYYLPALILMV